MEFGPFLIIALLMGIFPAYIAAAKGRNFLLWWLYGTFVFVIAIFHAIMLKPTARNLLHYGRRYCPHCEKIIDYDATSCEHCSREVVPLSKED